MTGDVVPSGWPPEEELPQAKVVPLFPLPNLFLFPGTVMPLHIFEPRYRQMIEDSLDGPGRLVIGTVLEGHQDQLADTPPVHEIAGLGEIAHQKPPPAIQLPGIRREPLDKADHKGMGPIAVSGQPHGLPAGPALGQPFGAGQTAARVTANGPSRERRRNFDLAK